ncbi:MAG TPA: BamA/TamA family outer membrane protein, partial [Polyangiaceae bacterium]
LFLALLFHGRAARADSAPLSAYESRTVKEAAARVHAKLRVDAHAEGKRIERVDVVIFDVFDEHDPIPDFVNAVHTMTRDFVIRQELLFEEGELYSVKRAEETARNLRTIRQLSLVLVVPLEGSAPDRVRVLVITRDVWSLRLNFDIEGGAGPGNTGINSLLVSPTEENFLGLHTTVGALFTLDPASYSVGGLASQRRLLGSRIETSVSASLIYNRQSGTHEGGFGSFTYGAPLRSTDDRWGWGTGIVLLDEIARRFDEGLVERFDAKVTPADDALPIQYRRQREVGGFEVVRSFGKFEKYDLYFGIEADRRLARYAHRPNADPRAEQELIDTWLPVNDTLVDPFVQLRTHVEDYLRTIDLETLALQESYRLGPEVLLKLYPSSSAFGSTRDIVGVRSGASYTLALGDGLLRAVADNVIEYDRDDRHDASIEASARFASPRVGFGRFVLDGLLHDRYQDALNRPFSLGGDGRLRGYAPAGFQGSFRGAHLVAANAEFRTSSVDILSAECGLAAFYDMGDAVETRLSDISPKQSVGIGFRALVPQLNRVVFRVDWGFPLTPGYSTFPGGVFVTFEQAFAMPALAAPTVMRPDLE